MRSSHIVLVSSDCLETCCDRVNWLTYYKSQDALQFLLNFRLEQCMLGPVVDLNCTGNPFLLSTPFYTQLLKPVRTFCQVKCHY